MRDERRDVRSPRQGLAARQARARVRAATLELYVTDLALLGEHKGDLARRGAARASARSSVLRRWTGTPSGALAQLVGIAAPHPTTTGASGFVALNVAPLLAAAPALPIAGGVTLDELGAVAGGPVSAVIPAGSVDIQIHARSSDPKPATDGRSSTATTSVKFFELARDADARRVPRRAPGHERARARRVGRRQRRCGSARRRVRRRRVSPARMTRDRHASSRPATGPAALWGRGTMLNLAGMAPATQRCSRRGRARDPRDRARQRARRRREGRRHRRAVPRLPAHGVGESRPRSSRRSSRSPAATS